MGHLFSPVWLTVRMGGWLAWRWLAYPDPQINPHSGSVNKDSIKTNS
jgi:hypothetical protein